ncbi:hypothetical protein [Putridiphycobacter roseus]|nr:hypothetical protein [Putridiphycobacter roseus]
MNKGKIEITRASQIVNFGRKINIYVNNEKICRLSDNETRTIEIDEGVNEIYARIDWCKTPPLQFEIKGGEDIKLELGSNVKGWKLAVYAMHYYLIRHSEFLYLQQRKN